MVIFKEINFNTIIISWTGSDDLSGVASYNVQVRAGEGAWTGWLTGTQRTEAEFVGSEGISYTFQVRASDRVGNNSEWTISGSSAVQGVTKFYYFNGQRVALRRGIGSGSKVYYLHGDHLGSTSLVTDGAGSTVSESRYAPFGELRWTRGASLTDFSFTGQRRDGFGLLDFNARYYSPSFSRFISADTIVAEKVHPLGWDRYSYTLNNPLIYVDPSGHITEKVKGNPRNMDNPSEDPVTVAKTSTPSSVNIISSPYYDSKACLYGCASAKIQAGVNLSLDDSYETRGNELSVTRNQVVLGVGAIDVANQILINKANANILENAAYNVDIDVFYNVYESGMNDTTVVSGIWVNNKSDTTLTLWDITTKDSYYQFTFWNIRPNTLSGSDLLNIPFKMDGKVTLELTSGKNEWYYPSINIPTKCPKDY